jgi:pSer/pThr/pTyr-binding forkhead associated (FHA) protein
VAAGPLTPQQGAQHPFAALQPALATPRLVTLLKDGSEGRSIPLTEKDADIGSAEGDITFPDDPYISPRHARIGCRAGAYSVRDLDSVNGVYVRLREDVELRDRDMLLVGQQVLRFEVLADGELPLGPAFQRGIMVFGTPEAARFARLAQYTTEGVSRDVHYLFRDETIIGRENGDIVFTDDPFLSRRHAAIRVDHAGRRFTLHDLGSSNGTALRIRGEHVLRDGDQFRIGRHLFRFEAGSAGGRGAR